MCPFGGLCFDSVNFVNPVQESDKLRFASTFQCACSLRAPHRLTGTGFEAHPRGDHLSTRSSALTGPASRKHLFSVRDHGRLRSNLAASPSFHRTLRRPDCHSHLVHSKPDTVTEGIKTLGMSTCKAPWKRWISCCLGWMWLRWTLKMSLKAMINERTNV